MKNCGTLRSIAAEVSMTALAASTASTNTRARPGRRAMDRNLERGEYLAGLPSDKPKGRGVRRVRTPPERNVLGGNSEANVALATNQVTAPGLVVPLPRRERPGGGAVPGHFQADSLAQLVSRRDQRPAAEETAGPVGCCPREEGDGVVAGGGRASAGGLRPRSPPPRTKDSRMRRHPPVAV